MPAPRPASRLNRAFAPALLAPLATSVAIAATLDLGPAWWTWPPLSRSGAAGTALALNTCLLLAACAVATPSRWWLGAATAAAFAAASLALLIAVGGAAAAIPLLAGHVVLLMGGWAMLAAGALARRLCRHPLDAAGATLGLAGLLVGGLLALGPAVPAVPTWLLNLLLRLNPVVAVTAAADIDLLRTGAIYHLSPVSHWRFDYPGWLSSALTYAGAAAVPAACARLRRAPGGRT